MPDALTPCDQCGSENVALTSWLCELRRPPRLEQYARCGACGYSGPSCKTEEEARARWNQAIE